MKQKIEYDDYVKFHAKVGAMSKTVYFSGIMNTITMISKDKVQEALTQMPEQFQVDELIELLIIIEKIEKGIKDSEGGKLVSEIEVETEINKWFK